MEEEAYSIHSSLGPLSKSYESIHQKLTPYFKKNFPWRIIVLQYCIDFCCTTTRISHNYMCIPSLISLPPPSHPTLLVSCSRVLWELVDFGMEKAMALHSSTLA